MSRKVLRSDFHVFMCQMRVASLNARSDRVTSERRLHLYTPSAAARDKAWSVSVKTYSDDCEISSPNHAEATPTLSP